MRLLGEKGCPEEVRARFLLGLGRPFLQDHQLRCQRYHSVPQPHCYSNFNDIIHLIFDMDADVITIENSQSDEKLLSVFREGVKYGAGIGPGVCDIRSPRIPSTEEIADRTNKMLAVLETNILWVNPDYGLRTRKCAEVKPALQNMGAAAELLRTQLARAK